jgi:N-acyl-D-amino-acid deacylase
LLNVGHRADVTVFDPAGFRDRATYDNPHQYPSGDRTTALVDREIVIETPLIPARFPERFSTRG